MVEHKTLNGWAYLWVVLDSSSWPVVFEVHQLVSQEAGPPIALSHFFIKEDRSVCWEITISESPNIQGNDLQGICVYLETFGLKGYLYSTVGYFLGKFSSSSGSHVSQAEWWSRWIYTESQEVLVLAQVLTMTRYVQPWTSGFISLSLNILT